MKIFLKRVYAEPISSDGKRILIDRLWPRGITKEKANVDLWLKEIAPSTDLRKWFAHDIARWNEFKKRYQVELNKNSEVVAQLLDQLDKNSKITLVYGAKDEEHNDAVVLKEYLEKENA